MRSNNLSLAIGDVLDAQLNDADVYVVPVQGDKGGSKPRKAIESPDSLHSLAQARIVDALSEGECEGFPSGANFLRDIYFDETPIENADGTRNFKNVSVEARYGTQTQEYIQGFPAVENEIAIGVALTQSTPWIRSLTNLSLSAARVRIQVAALSKTNQENGDITGHRIDYAIDVSVNGGSYSEVMRSSFNGKSSSAYERSHRIDLPQPGTGSGWNIRVRRLTANAASAYVQDTTSIMSITEIIDGKFRYPMTAVVATTLDASQFNQIPSRAYRFRGRRIKVPTNYNPTTGAYTGSWDGNFQVLYSNNPAWVFYDLVTNPRYGLGNLVSEAQVDKWQLYAIAQYCDGLVPDGFGGQERRFTCNLYLQKQGDAYRVLQDLASIFRGMCYWAGGSIVPVADKPATPVYTYTNANVEGGVFKYEGTSRKARHTACIVGYTDMTDFGRMKYDYYDLKEGVARYGYQDTQIVAMGCSSRGQAQRAARWLLLSENYLTNVCAWSVGMDGTWAVPGQVVRIADKWRAGKRMGGRVKKTVTNVAIRSQEIDNAVWTKTNVTVTANAAIAPDGSVTAERITANSTAAAHYFDNTTLAQPADNVTTNAISVYVKKDTAPRTQLVWINKAGTGFTTLEFRFDDKRVTVLNGAAGTKYRVDELANGWFRIVLWGMNSLSGATASRPRVFVINDWGVSDGGWGKQAVTATATADALPTGLTGGWKVDNVVESATNANHYGNITTNVKSGRTYRFRQYVKALGAGSTRWASMVLTGGSGLPLVSTFVLNVDLSTGAIVAGNAPTAGVTNASVTSVGGGWYLVSADVTAAADGAISHQVRINNSAGSGTTSYTGDGVSGFKVCAPYAWDLGGNYDAAAPYNSFNQTHSDSSLALYAWGVQMEHNVDPGMGPAPYIATVATAITGIWVDKLATPYPVAGDTFTCILPTGVSETRTIAFVMTLQGEYSGVIVPSTAFTSTIATETIWSVESTTLQNQLFRVISVAENPSGSYSLQGVQHNASIFDAVDLGTPIVVPPTSQLAPPFLPRPGTITLASVQRAGDVVASTLVTATWGAAPGAVIYEIQWRKDYGDWTTPLEVRGVTSDYQNAFPGIYEAKVTAINALGIKSAPQFSAEFTVVDQTLAPGQLVGAIAAAAAAQDTADGAVVTYYTPTAPTGATLGDLWFDTDDGNKLYRHNGTVWQLAADDDMALAITAAAGAQATADGKVKTYYAARSATPVASALGDLWYVTDERTLQRWSGSAWQLAGDNSLETQAFNTLVKDGGFEAGGGTWTLNAGGGTNWYFEVSSNASFNTGGRGLVRQASPVLGSSAYSATFPASNSDTFIVECYMRSIGGNGNPLLWCWQYDSTGAEVGSSAISSYNDVSSKVVGSTGWKKVVGSIVPLANTVSCRIGVYVPDQTTGYWAFDQFRATRIENGQSPSQNLIPNATFGGQNGHFWPWQIGWNPCGQTTTLYNKRTGIAGGSSWAVDGNIGMISNVFGTPTGLTPNVQDLVCGNDAGTLMPVVAGRRYQMYAKVAIHRSIVAMVVGWYNSAGSYITETGTAYTTIEGNGGKDEANYQTIGGFFVAPAGAVNARVWFRRQDTNAGQTSSYMWILKPFFGEAQPTQTEFSPWADSSISSADMVGSGSTYGVVNGADLWDSGQTRRIGLRVAGSAHRLGDQRNMMQSATTSYGSVRNTAALSATSAGVVTVNAHTVRYGGVSIAYSAVASAVTGLTPGAKYVIYCNDPNYAGGAQTWFAGANPDAVMQLGDGIVVAGEITIPTSGSSSGGGGSGGGGGTDWCVDADMLLPDGRRAGDIKAGDLIAVWNEDPDRPRIVMLEVDSNDLRDNVRSTRIVTTSGAEVWASDSTPMPMREGLDVLMPITEMLGREVLVRHTNGRVRWETVTRCESVGRRTVAFLRIKQKCYFAGTRAGYTIATHNPIHKP